jgi:predicted DNA binding CopG/RHH family protein
MLGNGDRALTAAWRIALDAGMFGNFPGFIYNEGAIRNWTNQNRVPPGGGIGIKGIGNLPLDQIIKPLPYKEAGSGFMALIKGIEDRMDRVASTGELPVGEGRADAPVGTTLALLEQATKVLAAVHIGLHDSQSQEFDLLKERYRQNPEAFWRWNKKGAPPWQREEFLRALDDFELVPAADPNTASHVIRLIKCQAVKTVAEMHPDMYDMKKVDAWIFKMIGVSDPDQFFSPPTENQPDPAAMAKLAEVQAKIAGIEAQGQQKMIQLQAEGEQKRQQMMMEAQESQAEHQARLNEIAADAEAKARDRRQAADEFALQSADRAADRASDERLSEMKIRADMVKQQREFEHDEQQMIADQMSRADETAASQEHEQREGETQREHEERLAAMKPAPGGGGAKGGGSKRAAAKPKGTPGPGGWLSMGSPKKTPF